MDELTMRKSDGKLRLVIVEDYKLARIGLRMALDADLHLEVIGEAETAQQGMLLIEQLQPDLAVIDLGLPDSDGFSLIHQIRRLNQAIKILVLTAHEDEEEVKMALACGANGYCLKDIESQYLPAVVKSLCNGACWIDPRVASYALQLFASKTHPKTPESIHYLTNREREVLRLIVEGVDYTEIAVALNISLPTTQAHTYSVMQKISTTHHAQISALA